MACCIELRLGLRGFRRRWAVGVVAASAVATAGAVLALGRVAEHAVRSAHAEYRDPTGLAYVGWPGDEDVPLVSGPVFLALDAATRGAARLAAVHVEEDVATLADGRSLSVTVASVSPAFFEIAGMALRSGRPFREDEVPAPVALVSETLLPDGPGGGSPASSIGVGARHLQVLGTVPAGARALGRFVDVWRPLDPSPHVTNIEVGGVRRPLMTVRSFAVLLRAPDPAQLSATVSRLAGVAVSVTGRAGLIARPFVDVESHATATRALLETLGWMSLALAGLAAVSLCLLLVAAGSPERHAFLIVGAPRQAFLRAVLTELGIVCVLGGVGGWAGAAVVTAFIDRILLAGQGAGGSWRPELAPVASGTACGVWMLAALAARVAQAAQEASGTAVRRSWMPVVRGALGGSVAVAVVGLGLAIEAWQTLSALAWRERGFDPQGVFAFTVRAPTESVDRGVREWQTLVSHLQGLPGTEAAGAATELPIERSRWRAEVRLRSPRGTTSTIRAGLHVVDPGFLSAMRIRHLEGATIEQESGTRAPAVWVSRMVEQQWLGGSHEGWSIDYMLRTWPIAGVLDDIDRGLVEPRIEPEIFLPSWTLVLLPPSVVQMRVGSYVAAVRWAGERRQLEESVRRLASRLPGQHLGMPRPVRDLMLDRHRQVIAATSLSSGVALCAVAACVAGTFSAAAFLARQRRRDMAVRLAIGASPARLILTELRTWTAIVVGGAGCGIGIVWLAGSQAGSDANVTATAGIEAALPAAGLVVLLSLGAAAWAVAARLLEPPARVLREIGY
jgi:hypothetical protein